MDVVRALIYIIEVRLSTLIESVHGSVLFLFAFYFVTIIIDHFSHKYTLHSVCTAWQNIQFYFTFFAVTALSVRCINVLFLLLISYVYIKIKIKPVVCIFTFTSVALEGILGHRKYVT